MKSLILILASLLLSFAALFAAEPQTRDVRNGVWTGEVDGDTLYMTIFERHRSAGRNHGMGNIASFELSVSSLDAKAIQQIRQNGNVDVALVRPAGTIALDGNFDRGIGAGRYRFTPSESFVREMAGLGFTGIKDHQLLMLAVSAFHPNMVRELRAMGFAIEQRHLDEIAVFRITPEVVREYNRLGFEKLTIRELINLRVGRVDAKYVNTMRSLGYADLSAHDIANMAIIGVKPEYIEELRRAGYEKLSARDLHNLKVGNVTAKYIQELRDLGYTNIPARDLANMGIMGVTPQFIEKMQKAGFEKKPTVRQLINLKSAGVTPEYAREMEKQRE